ncbi:MAG: hypothetical protein SVG88_11585 [Halobacteriales archaeon]|nr:hypothetical protein [Halobacteriales archaeon]
MGFSVSGSAAIVFVGVLLAGSILYPTVTNSFDRINSAQSEYNQDVRAMRDTDITIRTASYNASNDTLSVVVENTGATTLTVNTTDVLVDNNYTTTFQSRSVAGSSDTDLWLEGEKLRIEISIDTQPDRVKIATRYGIQAVAEVA